MRFLNIAALLLCTSATLYLLLPSPRFPPPPPDSLHSTEPADTETILRQAYYTNLSRAEIMQFYDTQFRGLIPIQYRLNLPPEDAYSLIRDQTRSSFIEEIIHPWRESLYINAFVPSKPSEEINIGSVHFLNKVTIHYIPSHPVTRLTVLLFTFLSCYWLINSFSHVRTT